MDTITRAVALPKEHGGWGFVVESILVGLVIAPGLPGVLLSVALIGVFLQATPLKFVLIDTIRHRHLPRTVAARRFAVIYGIVFVVPFWAAIVISPWPVWWPVAAAAPLFLLALLYILWGEEKALLPELAGALGINIAAGSIVVAGGLGAVTVLAVIVLLASRSVTSIVYVRHRLRRSRGKPHSVGVVLGVHVLGLGAVLWAGRYYPSGMMALAGYIVLVVRMIFGMRSTPLSTIKPQLVGIQEIATGIVYAGFLAVGYHLDAGQ